MEKRELVIIGAGPAGLSAAIYAKRAGLDLVVLEKGITGGQINLTDKIANWPGAESIGGADLANSFRKHAKALDAEIRDCCANEVMFERDVKRINTDKGAIEAKAVIIATGAGFRKLGCEGEERLTGAGVSYCAVCDAAFFEGLEVAVVGGGNAALEEAVYLANFASKVHLVHRRSEFRGDKAAVDAVAGNSKIKTVMERTVVSINGADFVESLTLKDVQSGNLENLSVSGVFIFVGTKPNVEIFGQFNSILEQDENGYIVTNSAMKASVEGVFAAGDVRSKELRQVVTAASDGAQAAVSAYKYIRNTYK